jgi:hypothetical protein
MSHDDLTRVVKTIHGVQDIMSEYLRSTLIQHWTNWIILLMVLLNILTKNNKNILMIAFKRADDALLHERMAFQSLCHRFLNDRPWSVKRSWDGTRSVCRSLQGKQLYRDRFGNFHGTIERRWRKHPTVFHESNTTEPREQHIKQKGIQSSDVKKRKIHVTHTEISSQLSTWFWIGFDWFCR